ncbi:MAG: hypothetical protein ACOX8H_02445 [Ruminococcus sp.]|jgi:hypothetical protein
MKEEGTCSNTRPCVCTYPGCENHGKCCACVAHHRDEAGGIPACLKKNTVK